MWHLFALLLGLIGSGLGLLLIKEYLTDEDRQSWHTDINAWCFGACALLGPVTVYIGLAGTVAQAKGFTIALFILLLFALIVGNIDVWRESMHLERRFGIKHKRTQDVLSLQVAKHRIAGLEYELQKEREKTKLPPPTAHIIGNQKIPKQWQQPFEELTAGRVNQHTELSLEGLSSKWELWKYQPTGTGTLRDLPLNTSRQRDIELLGIPHILDLPCSFIIPEKIRNQHTHIVAGSGHGKSELIKHLVMQDVRNGSGVIVIDSQNDLINWLATRIPDAILVDPVHCPPPLNLFSVVASAELFEYIFTALDAEMTAKQSTAYRYVSQMVQGQGSIHLMRRILEPGDTWTEYVTELSPVAQSFFQNEYASKQFAETRQQILRRLYQVLENTYFERMVGAEENKVDIAGAVATGRPVLISTSKDQLQQQGASLFGRIFIAQVMNAVAHGPRRRTYLYLDEFQDYAEDSPVLFNLFEQARKFELGLVVAHQYLGQLPPQLQQSISANTAIKFAGGVSADDARKLASSMFMEPGELRVPRGVFASYVKSIGSLRYPVPLETAPEITSLSAIREKMRAEFAVPEKSPAEEETPPKSTSEVPESGDW